MSRQMGCQGEVGSSITFNSQYNTRNVYIEFKAVMVLPEITRNYPYGYYVGNAPVGTKVNT